MDTPVETPYRRAKQEWDLRMGDALVRARIWRITTFWLLGICTILVGGIIFYAMEPKRVPYIIEIQANGEARYKGEIDPFKFIPSETHVQYYLKKFIEYTRTLSSDIVVVKKNWRDAYHYLTPAGSNILSTYAKELQPLVRYKDFRVDIKFTSILQHSQYTRQVNWIESVWNSHGELLSQIHWRGVFKYEFRFPSTIEHLEKNPLGFFVDSFNWTEVAE